MARGLPPSITAIKVEMNTNSKIVQQSLTNLLFEFGNRISDGVSYKRACVSHNYERTRDTENDIPIIRPTDANDVPTEIDRQWEELAKQWHSVPWFVWFS